MPKPADCFLVPVHLQLPTFELEGDKARQLVSPRPGFPRPSSRFRLAAGMLAYLLLAGRDLGLGLR